MTDNNPSTIMYNDISCRYFEKTGAKNTRPTLESAANRALELGIQKVLVATNSGRTAVEAHEVFTGAWESASKGPGMIIAVTHVTGFQAANHQELANETRRDLEQKGITVLTCQHAFGGVGRAIRNKLNTYQYDEIIAHTLRIFGQGTKVCIELALMAADAGLVRTDEDVIAIGGTGKGADTALLLQPANSFHFFDCKIKEVICKPVIF